MPRFSPPPTERPSCASLPRVRMYRQAISPEDKAVIVAEIKEIKGRLESVGTRILTLRTNEPSLVHELSDAKLRSLGAKDVVQARNPKMQSAKWLPEFLAKLKSCLVDEDGAFPGYEIKKNTTGNSIGGRKAFKGEYLNLASSDDDDTCALTRSPAHLLTCSPAHLLAHSLTCSLAHLLTCSPAHLLTPHPLTQVIDRGRQMRVHLQRLTRGGSHR